MAGWKLDTDGTTLDLTDGSTFKLLEQSFPMPDVDTQYATSVDATRDTLTGLRYKNRMITLKLLAAAASTALLETALAGVSQKVGKINRDAIVGGTGVGGTLQYTSSGGSVVTFDVVRANVVADTGFLYANRNRTTVTVELECLPAWRGTETTPGDHTETTLPVLTFTESSVTGDLPGLGRLVVDEDQSKDQLTVVYGVRSKNYSSDSTAALFWQAEALTAVAAGATAAAGPSGASGSGSNTMYANALTTTYQDLLKSTVSTTYWTHVGSYRVLVRAQAKSTNTGTVSLRASWAQADVTNYTQGTSAQLAAAGSWCMVDLGVVQVPQVVTGTQRWELRVQGSSTVDGDAVYADFVWLVPVDECSGVAEASGATTYTPTVSDDFTRSSGSLDADTPSPQTDGTNWVESTASSFTVDGVEAVRTTTGMTAGLTNAKFAVVGAAQTGQYAETQIATSVTPPAGLTIGAVLRYTNTSNWAAAVIETVSTGFADLVVYKCVAGAVSALAFSDKSCIVTGNHYYTISARVAANGAVTASLYDGATSTGTPLTTVAATDATLATGGALASGKPGIIDHYTSGTALSRVWLRFAAGTVTTDAACFSGQSIQVRHDGVVRSTASGIWTRPARFDGDYLLVPASGKEARPVEVTCRMSRTTLGSAGDDGVDDVSAKLYVQPRGLQLPS